MGACTYGYYVEMVVVEVVITKLGEHQLPIRCLRLATTSHASDRMYFKHISKRSLSHSHPEYDHLYAVPNFVTKEGTKR